MGPLHSSLGNRVRLYVKKIKKERKKRGQGTVAHTSNPSTLGGRGRWITKLGVEGKPGQDGETLSLLKIQNLAGHGGSPL